MDLDSIESHFNRINMNEVSRIFARVLLMVYDLFESKCQFAMPILTLNLHPKLLNPKLKRQFCQIHFHFQWLGKDYLKSEY